MEDNDDNNDKIPQASQTSQKEDLQQLDLAQMRAFQQNFPREYAIWTLLNLAANDVRFNACGCDHTMNVLLKSLMGLTKENWAVKQEATQATKSVLIS